MKRAFLWCVTCVCVAMSGCEPTKSSGPTVPSKTVTAENTSTENNTTNTPASSATDPSANAAEKPVTVDTATWAETEKRIAQQKGKVVVVDLWSTWCSPCVREFPHLVTLHEKYPDKVACVSVNCNFSGAAGESADDAREEVLKFLVEKNARFTNILCADSDTQVLDTLKAASVPVVRVYDKQGKLRKQFVNDDGQYGNEGFEYAKHIVPLIEELVAE